MRTPQEIADLLCETNIPGGNAAAAAILTAWRDEWRAEQMSEERYSELDDNILAALADAANSECRFTPAFFREVAEDYRRALLTRAPRAERDKR